MQSYPRPVDLFVPDWTAATATAAVIEILIQERLEGSRTCGEFRRDEYFMKIHMNHMNVTLGGFTNFQTKKKEAEKPKRSL